VKAIRRWWSVVRKCAREQKRDLWVLGLSLAFAPLFVVLYWLMTGGTGSTSYGVMVINQDVPVLQADGSLLDVGALIIEAMKEVTYENGSPLLRVKLIENRTLAEARLRNRESALLIILPSNLSYAIQKASLNEETSAKLIFTGDLTNPYYTITAIMTMTAVDYVIRPFTNSPQLIVMDEIPLGGSAARTEFENYMPGLMVMAVILLIFQAAMMTVREVEAGKMIRLRLSRLKTIELLGGITAWMMVIATISVLLTFLTAVLCGFKSQGSIWIAVVVGLITNLSIIGVGMIVASFSKTVAQAFVIANFPLGFFMFLTGAAFPLPRNTLFTIAGRGIDYVDFLAPTHAVIALNKIFTLGLGLKDVTYELISMTFLSIIYFLIGAWLFNKRHLRAMD
jgi:ABC-2 type transport system permease protein